MASIINASTAGVGGVITTADNTGILNIQTAGTTAITVDASQRAAFVAGTAAAPAITTVGDTNTGIFFPAADTIAFAEGGAEAMRIDSSGNLMVGSTSGSAKLSAYQTNSSYQSVYAEHSGTGGVCLINATNVAYNSGVLGLVTGATAGTGFNFLQGWSSNFGSERFKIVGNGNMQNVNNSYGAISDIKLKENIIDATPKLDKLLQVKIRNYNLKTDPDQKQIGVIAQELETIFPSLIEESEDKDKDNNDLGTTTKAVKYSVFVPILIKAIQEQQALIENLTTRLSALENK
jgi:hypothetical protein